MCEIKYDYPNIYLLEFHIGDGYFDRQSIGEYSVVVNYRENTNLLIKEKERGDDRLVKFRQGKSVIFGIENPKNEMKVIFQAFDNNQEIGKSSIYFLGIGGPSILAAKSLHTPTASVIRTNLQLSHGAGSLQVFARLTCFGISLLTDFTVSDDVNTEFDTTVNDIELTAEESFTRCRFDLGDVKDCKDLKNEEEEEISKIDDSTQLNTDSNLCYYEASSIIQEESDDLVKQAILQNKNNRENIHSMLSSIAKKAVDLGNSKPSTNTETRQIRNLDDLMFTNFVPPDDSTTSQSEMLTRTMSTLSLDRNSVGESKFSLSPDNSVLDLKNYDDAGSENDDREDMKGTKLNIPDVCIEPKIGDAPVVNCAANEEEKDDKSNDDIDDADDKRPEEIPCETGDAPTSPALESSDGDVQQFTSFNQTVKKRKFNQQMNEIELCSDKEDEVFPQEDNLNSSNEEKSDQTLKEASPGQQESPPGHHTTSQTANSKRKYAKGKRRAHK